MIEVRMINEARKADINLPNEPFGLFGRMEPSYADGDIKRSFLMRKIYPKCAFPMRTTTMKQ